MYNAWHIDGRYKVGLWWEFGFYISNYCLSDAEADAHGHTLSSKDLE